MVIYTEFLDSLDAAIDQSQSMLLAISEAEFGQASVVDAGARSAAASAVTTCKIHFPVDEIVVRWWPNQVLVCEVSPYDTLKDGKVGFVVVIIERHRAKIDVVCMI